MFVLVDDSFFLEHGPFVMHISIACYVPKIPNCCCCYGYSYHVLYALIAIVTLLDELAVNCSKLRELCLIAPFFYVISGARLLRKLLTLVASKGSFICAIFLVFVWMKNAQIKVKISLTTRKHFKKCFEITFSFACLKSVCIVWVKTDM
jgi:hypothetical protein